MEVQHALLLTVLCRHGHAAVAVADLLHKTA
jgi:hypothetical protein